MGSSSAAGRAWRCSIRADAPFPSGGAAQQAALLVADRLCALGPNLPTVAAPHADERSDSLLAALDPTRDAPVRRRVARPLVTTSRLRELAAALVAELGPALKAAHREDPDALLAEALEVLEAQDLVRPVPGGVALMPALARFRDVSLKAAEAELASQLGLFGGAA